eukprot:199595_1
MDHIVKCFFTDTYHDRSHKRELIRKAACKSSPKWRSMMKSFAPKSRKFLQFSFTRFWGFAGPVFHRILMNYIVSIQTQNVMIGFGTSLFGSCEFCESKNCGFVSR